MQVLLCCYRAESSSTLRKTAWETAGRIHPASEGEEHHTLWLSPSSCPAAALSALELLVARGGGGKLGEQEARAQDL